MLTATIENILNRGLPRSPRARELCAELAGKRIAVEIRGLADLLIRSDGDRLVVCQGPTGDAEARIRGGPFALLALAGSDPATALRRAGGESAGSGVQLEGDTGLAERFRELALLLKPDLEEELSLAIGDVPAHQVGRFVAAAASWWRNAAQTTVRNVAEYLAHERGDLVSRAEGRQLLEGIDETRERVDRIEARIALLESRRS